MAFEFQEAWKMLFMVQECLSMTIPHRVVVSLDLSNAFSTVSRQAFMDQVEHFFPDLAAWIWECYGQKQFLLVKKG